MRIALAQNASASPTDAASAVSCPFHTAPVTFSAALLVRVDILPIQEFSRHAGHGDIQREQNERPMNNQYPSGTTYFVTVTYRP